MPIFNMTAGGGGNGDIYTDGDARAGYIYAPHASRIGELQFAASSVPGYNTYQIQEAYFPNVSFIGKNAFYGQLYYKAEFPLITSKTQLASSAFSHITFISLPNLTGTIVNYSDYFHILSGGELYAPQLTIQSISSYAGDNQPTRITIASYTQFAHFPSSLQYISMSRATTLIAASSTGNTYPPSGDAACPFGGCQLTQSVYLPNLTTISGGGAFAAAKMSSIYFSKLTTITGGKTFCYCTSLKTVDLPELTTMGADTFWRCTALSNVSLPKLQSVPASAFYSCTALSKISLPKVQSIGNNAFYSCTSLHTLDLGSVTTLVTLANSNAFTSTQISTGSIYVPASLYNSFKTATNWAYFSSRMISV